MKQFLPFDLVIPRTRRFPKDITPKQGKSTNAFTARLFIIGKIKNNARAQQWGNGRANDGDAMSLGNDIIKNKEQGKDANVLR